MGSRKIAAFAKRAALSLACAWASCGVLTAQQPASGPAIPTITVTAREVQIPIEAFYLMGDYVDEVLDLKLDDFHVEAGGQAQPITGLRHGKGSAWALHDDFGYHVESATSFGIWSQSDAGHPTPLRGSPYYLAFTPALADANACYAITVTVDRPHVQLGYPSEYCGNTTPADPLVGTKVDTELLSKLDSKKKGNVSVHASSGVFLSKSFAPTWQLALTFPTMHSRIRGYRVFEPIALVGKISNRQDGATVGFSDLPVTSSYWRQDYMTGPHPQAEDFTYPFGEERYTRQFGLAAGDYSLEQVLANGGHFGRVEMPIHVPAFNPAALWMSSVFVCRRFHKPTEEEFDLMPPQYTPLLSRGMEFEPAGDTRFTVDERLTLWFQIYAPPRAAPLADSIRYRVKLVNAKTGAIVSDSGPSEVGVFVQPGNPVLSLWKEVPIGKLRPGPYRIDVEATDSATGKTVQQSSPFTLVKRRD